VPGARSSPDLRKSRSSGRILDEKMRSLALVASDDEHGKMVTVTAASSCASRSRTNRSIGSGRGFTGAAREPA